MIKQIFERFVKENGSALKTEWNYSLQVIC